MDLRPDFGTLTLEDRIRLIMSAWQSELPRLLVFDNCEDESLLVHWRPPSGGSRVLVTSRREQWDPALGLVVISLNMLSRPDSVALMCRTGRTCHRTTQFYTHVAGELGDLPLALHLAGSYLWRYRMAMTPGADLSQLQREDLLVHRSLRAGGFSPTGHEQDVARAFATSYERLDPTVRTDAMAATLLAEAAYLAPGEVVAVELLLPNVAHSGGEDDDALDTRLEVEDALARLVELGLLQTTLTGGVRLHRLLAAYVRRAADVPGAREQVAAQVIAGYDRLQAEGNLIQAATLAVHLHSLADEAVSRPPESLTAALCGSLGDYLRANGDTADSVRYLQLGLVCAQAVLGEGDPH